MKKRDLKEILSEMTLQEKAGQLRQKLYGFESYDINADGSVSPADCFVKEVEKCKGLGFLYGLLRSDPWSKKDYDNGLFGALAPKAYNALQEYVISHNRFNIPMMVSCECPHGNQMLDGYLLPVNLAAGASFNARLLAETSEISGKQLKAVGSHIALMSMLDVLRDPRWGRSEECYSEDPYLSAKMAEAAVKGMQSVGVACCAKHFAAQGQTTGGVNASSALIGTNEFESIHMPAAKAAVAAGTRAIMAAYNDIDGVPCHGNAELLRGILREKTGFDGLIMADGVAIDRLDDFTGGHRGSAAAALKAGVDVGLWDQAYDYLEEAVSENPALEEYLDQAVLRALEEKERAGLFDNPYVPENDAFISFAREEEYIEKNVRLAEESLVLLENKKTVLPLKKGSRLIVTGPSMDDIYRMCGDYTPYLRQGSFCTIVGGLQENDHVEVVPMPEKNFLQTASLAKEKADAVILCLGGTSSRFEGATFDTNGAAILNDKYKMDCGEGVDLSSLELPKEQYKLAEAAKNTGLPVITILVAGRPYVLKNIPEDSDALIYSFYPGPYGGRAIADVLTGKRTPSGLLPVSIPDSVGQLPVYYNYRMSYEAMKYSDKKTDRPSYSFGYGLSYTEFEYEDFVYDFDENGRLVAEVKVTNSGQYDGAHTLLVFARMKGVIDGKLCVPRVRELKGFEKIYLKKGEKKTVRIETDIYKDRTESFSLSNGRENIVSIKI